jgi:hypothetical protein
MANVMGVVARDGQSYTVMSNAVRFDLAVSNPDPLNVAIERPIFRAAKDPQEYAKQSAFNRTPDEPGLGNGPIC